MKRKLPFSVILSAICNGLPIGSVPLIAGLFFAVSGFLLDFTVFKIAGIIALLFFIYIGPVLHIRQIRFALGNVSALQAEEILDTVMRNNRSFLSYYKGILLAAEEKSNLAETDEDAEIRVKDAEAYLKENADKNTSLSDLIRCFENMCKMHAADCEDRDNILYEIYTDWFGADNRICFSLVRQVAGEEDEFYQLHMEMLYEPNQEHSVLSETVWDYDTEENIFDYVRKSEAYNLMKAKVPESIRIYMDET